MNKYDIDDIINIYKNSGLLALIDYIQIHGASVYDSDTLVKIIIALGDTLITMRNYYDIAIDLNKALYAKLLEAKHENY